MPYPTAQYSCEAVKYDRRGYKPRARTLLLSGRALYVAELASKRGLRLKHRLPLDRLRLVITTESDQLALVKIPQDLKKDKVLLIPLVMSQDSYTYFARSKVQLLLLHGPRDLKRDTCSIKSDHCQSGYICRTSA